MAGRLQALPFLLAWKLNAKPGTFGSYYLADMERLFRESKYAPGRAFSPISLSLIRPTALFSPIRITTSPALKKYLTSIESTMYPAAPPKKKSSSSASAAARPDNYADQQLCDFYAFLFPFIKEEGQKSLNGQMAVAVWGVVLAPRYPIAKSFVEYASVSGYLQVLSRKEPALIASPRLRFGRVPRPTSRASRRTSGVSCTSLSRLSARTCPAGARRMPVSRDISLGAESKPSSSSPLPSRRALAH